jgi:ribosome-associated toxin RatA of RatAB toxin-antitoxin module
MKRAQLRFMINSRFLLSPLFVTIFSVGAAAQTPARIIVHEDGSAWRIEVTVMMSASQRQIWSELTNCARAKDFIPHFETCRVMEKDPANRWDVRENISNPPFLPRIRTVIRSDYRPPQAFSYKLVSGDLKRSEGSWELIPQPVGTRVHYKALFEPKISAPSFMMVSAIKSDLSEMFSRLERLSIANTPD